MKGKRGGFFVFVARFSTTHLFCISLMLMGLMPSVFATSSVTFTQKSEIGVDRRACAEVEVWAKDEFTGEMAWKQILAFFITHPDELVHLSYDVDGDGIADETLSGTEPHPFWVVGREEFVPMGELERGQVLNLAHGGRVSVTETVRERAPPGETFTTYNFEVADFHTYFVGEAGVWVHNEGEACKRVFGIFSSFKRRNGGDAVAAWKSTEVRLFGVADKAKDTARTLGAALDEVMRKDVIPGHQGDFFTSTSSLSETDNLGIHVWKHIYDKKDMADLATDGITYVQRALELSGKTSSSGGIRVAEGVRARSGVLERLVLNENTGEFTIKVLGGDQAGRIRTLFKPDNPLEYFNQNVAADAMTLK